MKSWDSFSALTHWNISRSSSITVWVARVELKRHWEMVKRQSTWHTRLLIFIWALAFHGNNHNENLFYNKYMPWISKPVKYDKESVRFSKQHLLLTLVKYISFICQYGWNITFVMKIYIINLYCTSGNCITVINQQR